MHSKDNSSFCMGVCNACKYRKKWYNEVEYQ